MIEIHINPVRVEKVVFVSACDVEEDFDFAAWQAIRSLVNQIDLRLAEVSDLAIKERGSVASKGEDAAD